MELSLSSGLERLHILVKSIAEGFFISPMHTLALLKQLVLHGLQEESVLGCSLSLSLYIYIYIYIYKVNNGI